MVTDELKMDRLDASQSVFIVKTLLLSTVINNNNRPNSNNNICIYIYTYIIIITIIRVLCRKAGPSLPSQEPELQFY